MALIPGTRLGAYEILSTLGVGGMGEVYRARDTRLGRDVAFKILPPSFATDPDRLARFEREARLLAALNHPHIAAIYGLEEADGVRGLILELVEGPTLAELLRAGPLPLTVALETASQIAEALEAAHERGILHRDLKPANVKIAPNSGVKVLDFGLAKDIGGDAAATASEVPTLSGVATREGVLLGTPAYMSPEQARGQALDKRSDIWAFGCVLYEMLTGRPAFAGETLSDTIAAILEREPDWTRLPVDTLSGARRVLRRCLEKDRGRRLRDIADARLELEETVSSAREELPVDRGRSRRQRFIWVVTATAALSAAVSIPLWFGRPSDSSTTSLTVGPMTRLTWDSGLTTDPSVSSDGRLIAYASDRGGDGNLDIWVQQTSGGPPIRLTADAADEHEPHLAADGSLVAFRSERDGGGVQVVPTLGGDARLIAPRGRGPRLSPDGRAIAFWTGPWLAARAVQTTRQTYVVSTTGGEPVQVASELQSAGDPIWSPDGKALLILGRQATSGADAEADWWWVPLDGQATKSGAYERMRAVGILTPPPGGSDYPFPGSWTEDGVLFTATTGSGDARNIWLLPVDGRSGRTVGDPRQITAGPARMASPAVSRDGRLVFSDLVERVQLLGLPIESNAGRAAGTPKPLRADAARVGSRASASQDGRWLAFGILGFAGSEVWTRDLHTGRERQLAAIPLASLNPLISRTGLFVAYTAIAEERGAGGGVGAGYVMGAQGGAPRKVCDMCAVIAFADDQHVLIGTDEPAGVWLLDVDTRERMPLLRAGESDPRLSWDRQRMAFVQGDTIYVAPFKPGLPMEEHERAPIAKRVTNADRATGWSPDSSVLYLLLERDGFRCLYAVKIDPRSGRPQGDVFPVYHFHNARWRWGSTSFASAVVDGLFISGQSERNGNVWTTTLSRR